MDRNRSRSNRMAAVLRLLDHPAVEGQPGQFAVDETRRRGRIDGRRQRRFPGSRKSPRRRPAQARVPARRAPTSSVRRRCFDGGYRLRLPETAILVFVFAINDLSHNCTASVEQNGESVMTGIQTDICCVTVPLPDTVPPAEEAPRIRFTVMGRFSASAVSSARATKSRIAAGERSSERTMCAITASGTVNWRSSKSLRASGFSSASSGAHSPKASSAR